ncbi:MAG: flagellar protein, partial [Spirochaetes bacterium]|nr:flagellar protein [Spirochaetota bacterium]
MKRLFTGAVITILLCCGAAAFADTSVLVDFAKLAADVTIGTGKVPNENKATVMDFSEVAGSSFTDEERAAMKTSLALDNWEVLLASSSRSVANQSFSMTKEAAVKSTAKKIPGTDTEIGGKKVLGVRVHFPVESYNSWAIVKPPFEIPAYMDKRELQGTRLAEPTAEEKGQGRMFDGNGVV